MPDQSQRKRGIVKWFSRLKGYGFIEPEDGGEEVFVHYTAIAGDGYRNLYEGDQVEYTEVNQGKGSQAHDVMAIRDLPKSTSSTTPAPVAPKKPAPVAQDKPVSSAQNKPAPPVKKEPPPAKPTSPKPPPSKKKKKSWLSWLNIFKK